MISEKDISDCEEFGYFSCGWDFIEEEKRTEVNMGSAELGANDEIRFLDLTTSAI